MIKNEQIEEAAKEAADRWRAFSTDENGMCNETPDEVFNYGFEAGANWMREQMVKEIEETNHLFVKHCQIHIPRADVDELVELLESARGWVSTHAMQTYSRVASNEADKITEALTNYRSKHGEHK
jgi:hypothetical protein